MKIVECEGNVEKIIQQSINNYYQEFWKHYPSNKIPNAADLLNIENGIVFTAKVIKYREIIDRYPEKIKLGSWEYELTRIAEEYYYKDKPVILDCKWEPLSIEYPMPYDCQYAQFSFFDENGKTDPNEPNYLNWEYDGSDVIGKYFLLSQNITCDSIQMTEFFLAEEVESCCSFPYSTTSCFIGRKVLVPIRLEFIEYDHKKD